MSGSFTVDEATAIFDGEEYTSCVEGAGCSRKSLHKQLSATVKAKGKSSYFFSKLHSYPIVT